MPAFQNGFSRKVKISADHDDFPTFHTREKSRLAYTDVRLLAWRGISCVCDGAAHSHFGNLLQADTGRACDGADKGVTKCDTLGETGRACDGAGLTYANMVRRKG